MIRTSPARPWPRLGRALVAVALAVCALPAGASAAVLSGGDGTLFYQGGSERNALSVRQVAGALIVSDPAGLSNRFLSFTDRGPCAAIDRRTMRCPGVKRVEARMAGGDDIAGPIHTHLPVEIRGESGNDTYEAGNPSFLTNVEFVGGSDLDTASYAGSQGAGGGRGVRITNDGVPTDGRIGLDTDNIGRDVETLIGSPFGDEILANQGNQCCGEVRGGQGDDVLRAGSGTLQVRFEMGSVADGADTIVGGLLDSSLDYSDRTRPINATLNFGGADDGEAGERDEILGGHEFVTGGQAGDTFKAPPGSHAPHSFSGQGGKDTIFGSDGNDTITGGADADDISTFLGADRIFANDGAVDAINCGGGTDSADLDPDGRDNVQSCDLPLVGVLRLAPKTLRARASQIARLRLSWRHPQGWRQLRRVELRVLRGDARVAAIRVRPRDAQITADGAVRLGRRARLVRKGKAVSARLALRLDRSLAGRRLRVDVEAVDVRGARQLERRAGSIRVTG